MRFRAGLLISMLFIVLIAASYSTALLSPSSQEVAQVGTPSALCAGLVDQAVATTSAGCGSLGRNTACYGNRTVAVAFREGSNLTFNESGDVVDLLAVQRLSTAPLNPQTNDWGIAVLKAQANLPGTLPGQNVTFILFGDTTTDNPTPDMRAVTINTRLGAPACEDTPNSAVLIQSPQETQVEMVINGGDVTLGSTAFVTAVQNGDMTIAIIDGTGIITAFGKTVVVPPGAQVRLPLGTTDGLQVIGPPSDLEPFDYDAIILAPLSLLPYAVTVPQPIVVVAPTRTGCTPRTDWAYTYTVPFGDTLSRIAGSIGMSTAALAEGNCITNANVLVAGQVIRTPRPVPPFVFSPTPVCGNDVCEVGETSDTCDADCGYVPSCGNGVCDTSAGENIDTCAVDCTDPAPSCGDGVCDPDVESPDSCAEDCSPPPVCGNDVCEIGENGTTCAADCVPDGPYCGDGTCDPGEDFDSCSTDCPLPPPPICGNGTCEPGEDFSTCSLDCPD